MRLFMCGVGHVFVSLHLLDWAAAALNFSDTVNTPRAPENLSPGFGPELETSAIQLEAEQECSLQDTIALKGALVGNLRYKDWSVTGDSTPLKGGLLNIEIIGDGLNIKLGTGAVHQTSLDIKDRMLSWDLSKIDGQKVQVQGSKCGDWVFRVRNAKIPGEPIIQNVMWEGHFTFVLPLEAIHDIFLMVASGERTPFLPDNPNLRDNMIPVTEQFFQADEPPNGITPQDATKDVLGFFSFILSYAKGTRKISERSSPKNIIPIMPRTNFTTILEQLDHIKLGSLFNLTEILGCYELFGQSAYLDDEYCDGTEEEPKPNGFMKEQNFIAKNYKGQQEQLFVKDWIDNMKKIDLLSKLDATIFGGQFGGLKGRLEYVYETTRLVPLYEFRATFEGTLEAMVLYTTELEIAILANHKKYPKIPT